jgi:hypothetical protein
MFLQKITKHHALIIFSVIVLAVLVLPNSTLAAGQILPKCADNGSCQLCDIIQTALNIFKLLLGILGAAALLMFIWHGISILTSAGNTEKVSSGFKGMGNTLIGILLILGSWLIVNTVVAVATGNFGTAGTAVIFQNKDWSVCPDLAEINNTLGEPFVPATPILPTAPTTPTPNNDQTPTNPNKGSGSNKITDCTTEYFGVSDTGECGYDCNSGYSGVENTECSVNTSNKKCCVKTPPDDYTCEPDGAITSRCAQSCDSGETNLGHNGGCEFNGINRTCCADFE